MDAKVVLAGDAPGIAAPVAARLLNMTPASMYSRIKHGTMPARRETNNRWTVCVVTLADEFRRSGAEIPIEVARLVGSVDANRPQEPSVADAFLEIERAEHATTRRQLDLEQAIAPLRAENTRLVVENERLKAMLENLVAAAVGRPPTPPT